MMIYTGTPSGCKAKAEKIRNRGMGVMLSTPKITPELKNIPIAIDNGAFQMWRRNYPFIERYFNETLDNAFRAGLKPDFIVCPDLVARGEESLKFSMEWATKKLRGCPVLALAVQDGLDTSWFDEYILHQFSHIFVGGTLEWKWRTAKDWIDFAHKHGKNATSEDAGRHRICGGLLNWGPTVLVVLRQFATIRGTT